MFQYSSYIGLCYILCVLLLCAMFVLYFLIFSCILLLFFVFLLITWSTFLCSNTQRWCCAVLFFLILFLFLHIHKNKMVLWDNNVAKVVVKLVNFFGESRYKSLVYEWAWLEWKFFAERATISLSNSLSQKSVMSHVNLLGKLNNVCQMEKAPNFAMMIQFKQY